MSYDIAIKLNYYDSVLESTSTLRFSNRGFISNIVDGGEYYYEPYIKDSIIIKRDGKTDSVDIILINDGTLDIFKQYILEGYDLTVYISYKNTDNFYTLWTGKTESVLIKNNSVSVKGKSKFDILNDSINPSTFLGDLVTDPYDGDEDLKDQTKPRLIGRAFNIKPVLINPARLIFGFNWGRDGNFAKTEGNIIVRDGGNELIHALDFSTTALMDAAAQPAIGYYYTCKNDSTFRLQTQPIFDVTIDTDVVFKYDQWIQIIAEETEISGYSIHSAPDYTIGGYFERETSYKNANNKLSKNLDVSIWFDNSGGINTSTIIDKGEVPNVSFVEAGIEFTSNKDIAFSDILSDKYELPINKLTLNYRENYNTQEQTSLAGELTEEEKAIYKQEWKSSVIEKIWTTEIYPVDNDIELESAIYLDADADIEAQRILSKYSDSYGLDYYTIKCPILSTNNIITTGVLNDGPTTSVDFSSTSITCDSTTLTMDNGNSDPLTKISIVLGDAVTLTATRFGLSNTRGIVSDIEINTRTFEVSYQIQIPRN